MSLNKNRAKRKKTTHTKENKTETKTNQQTQEEEDITFRSYYPSLLSVFLKRQNLPATSCSSKHKDPRQLTQSLLDWLASKPVVPVLSPQS